MSSIVDLQIDDFNNSLIVIHILRKIDVYQYTLTTTYDDSQRPSVATTI